MTRTEVALITLVPLLIGLAIMLSSYQTNSTQQNTSYRRCVVNTRNIWADVVADRADGDREGLLAVNEANAAKAYAHRVSAQAHREAAVTKRRATEATEDGRRGYCRLQWPRLKFLGIF